MMHVTGSRRSRCVRGILGVIGLGMTAVLVGCSSAPKQGDDLLLIENTELRQRNSELESMLADADQRYATLAADYDDVASELDSARSNQGSPGAATGFEGISGVNSGRTAGGEVVLNIAGDVLFDSGSANLKADAKTSLSRVAQVLQSQYPGNIIRIEGYTDSDPIRKSSWKTNERLSAERAMSVEEYLVKQGVRNDRVYSAAFGSAVPRSSKAQSRRVEIVILAQQG